MAKRNTNESDLFLPLLVGHTIVPALILLFTLILCLAFAYLFVLLADLSGTHALLWIVMGISWFTALMR